MRAAIVIGLLAAPSVATAQTEIQSILDALVYVESRGQGGQKIEAGTGVIINKKGYIVTAKHVLGKNFDPATDTVWIRHKSKASAEVRARRFKCSDEPFDICILHVSTASLSLVQPLKAFELKCSMPAIRTPVMAAGFPPGEFSPATLVSGIISTDEPGESFKYYMDTATSPGMSGGPVFGANNTLFGVVHGKGKETAVFLISHFGPVRSMIEEAESPCPFETITIAGTQLVQKMSLPFTIAKNLNVTIEEAKKIEAAVPAKPLGRIYLQIPNQSYKKSANEVVALLRAAGLPIDPQIEDVDESKSPKSAEIRYFQDSALSQAMTVKKILSEKANLNFEIRRLNLSAPEGNIEVWWPAEKRG